MSDSDSDTPSSGEDVVAAAEQEAEESNAWWHAQWLKFPTVSLDDLGEWHYWDVPEDSGVFKDDWRLGEDLARDTVAQMQRFEAGSSVLRRIVRAMDPETIVAQGFLTRIEDMLTRPQLYLMDLEPGSVRQKLGAERGLETTPQD